MNSKSQDSTRKDGEDTRVYQIDGKRILSNQLTPSDRVVISIRKERDKEKQTFYNLYRDDFGGLF